MTRRSAVVAAIVAVVLAFGAAPALAGQQQASSCDPVYGCSQESQQPTTATCALSTYSFQPGATVNAHIENIPVGAEVHLLFDGVERSSAVATAKPGTTDGSADFTFTVPSDADPNERHTVVMTGNGFSCDPSAGNGVEVLGEVVERGPSSSGGPLARTGVEITALLAAAVVALLVGRELVRAAQRRKSRIAVQQPRGFIDR